MKNIFIGGIFPEERMEEIQKTEYISDTVSSDTLQKNIIKGIEEHTKEHLTIFNTYFLHDRHHNFKRVQPYIWTCKKDGGINYNLPYVRLRGYSLFSKACSVRKNVLKWLKENNTNETTNVIVYPAYFPFLMALTKIKKKFPINVCLVVADLPQYMGLQERKTLYQKLSLKVTMYLFNKHLPVVDKFVLLTEEMNKFVNKENKPYVVMEGIASELYEYMDLPKQENPKVVLYSGGMQKKYGIPNILEATKLISDSSVEFRFYGKGDAVDLIKAYAKEDNRIKYMGSIGLNELHIEQQKSTILINPRQNNEEFTKYSFPSKNLEYMLSGRPTICYKLDGMPDEYKDYLIIPEDDSVESLAKAISTVLSMTDEKQKKIGQKARDFVLNNKNYIVQTKRIIELIGKSE